MAVTDLTGTTWLFNNSVNVDSIIGYTSPSYSVTYEDGYGNNWNVLNVDNSKGLYIYYVNSNDKDSHRAYVDYSGWDGDGYKTITITSGSDTSNSDLIAILQANATQVVDSVTITYNNTTIATITEDGSKTLPTNGKCMATDIVVSGTNVSSAAITYNGNTIATGTGTFTKTLQCAGKVMATDVTITAAISSIIYTFENGELTISNAPYEFNGGELTV